MINLRNNFLTTLLLLACDFACAGGDIDQHQWCELKHVVFKNMDLSWTIEFNKRYPRPSEDGVRALAQQLDFDENDMHGDEWLKLDPEQLNVSVNCERIYGLTLGRLTKIICDERQKTRQRKNQ